VAVSTQVATPRVPVYGVHRWVRLVLKDTGWPPSGRPDAVSVAVRVNASRGLRPLRGQRGPGRVTVWVSVPTEVA
jgi:hypothetical protein